MPHPRREPPPLTPLFIVIPGKLARDRQVSHAAKLLYGILMWLANEDALVWVSPLRAGEVLGLEDRQTRSLYVELRDRGYIVKVADAIPGEMPTTYRLTVFPEQRQEITARQKTAGGERQEIAASSGKNLPAEEHKLEESSPPPGPLSTEFSPEVENAIAPYVRSSGFPESVRAVIRAALSGMNVSRAATPEEVVAAVSEMQAGNVLRFGARVFRGFLTRVQEKPPAEEEGVPQRRISPRPGRGDGMADQLRRLSGGQG